MHIPISLAYGVMGLQSLVSPDMHSCIVGAVEPPDWRLLQQGCSGVILGCVRRGTEVVEGVLRHHISACFAALQRKLLDLLHDALPGLRTVTAAGTKAFPGSPQTSPALEVCIAPLHRIYALLQPEVHTRA